jgi:2'-5' RNA ligase
MSRLFTGIALPDSIKTNLLEICFGIPGARWETEDKLHLSLRFIGDVEGQTFKDIQTQLGEIKFAPFSLQIKGTGIFPPRGDPRILWAGIEENEKLRILQRKVENVLVRQVGLKPEGRKYFPHITLARLKKVRHQDIAGFIMEHSLLKSETFDVHEFHLFSSILSPKGSKYFIECSYRPDGN